MGSVIKRPEEVGTRCSAGASEELVSLQYPAPAAIATASCRLGLLRVSNGALDFVASQGDRLGYWCLLPAIRKLQH